MTESQIYRDTHKADVIQNPDLFRMNTISYEDQLLNLCALLAEQDPEQAYITLPTNGDMLLSLSSVGESAVEGDRDRK